MLKIGRVSLVPIFAIVCIFAVAEGEKVVKKKVRVVAGGTTIKLASEPDIVGLKEENLKYASSLPSSSKSDPEPLPPASLSPAESQIYIDPAVVVKEVVEPLPVVKTVDLHAEPSLHYGHGPYYPILPIGHHHHSYKNFGKTFGIRFGPYGHGIGIGFRYGRGYHSVAYPGFRSFHKGFHKSFHLFG